MISTIFLKYSRSTSDIECPNMLMVLISVSRSKKIIVLLDDGFRRLIGLFKVVINYLIALTYSDIPIHITTA